MSATDHPFEEIRSLAENFQLNLLDREFALKLDETDELREKRGLFWIPAKQNVRTNGVNDVLEGDSVYLAGNSLGLQPKSVRAALEVELESWKNLAVQGHFRGEHPWVVIDEIVEPHLSNLVGAIPGEVAVMGTLTNNIHTLMVPFYRPTSTRNKILIEKAAFPSDWYIAVSQLAVQGFNPNESLIEVGPDEGEFTLNKETILETIRKHANELALVLLPGVQYATGQVLPIKEITELCRSLDIKVGWDLAHAIGNIVLDLHDWNVDFACWCSYKYLNSGPGGIAGIFVHSRYANEPLPRFAGWWGHDANTRFDMDKPFHAIPGAFGFRHSNPSVLTTVSLSASLEIFGAIGIKKLRQKSVKLTAYFEYLIDQKLTSLAKIITPRDIEYRGCQLSLLFEGDRDPKLLEKQLMDKGIVCDVRGKIIRAAPTPLYNQFVDVYDFVEALVELCR